MDENVFSDFQGKYPQLNKDFLKKGAIILVLVILLFNTVEMIDTQYVGVILTLGKYTGTMEAGINFKLPLVQRVIEVPVQVQQKREFGFRTQRAGQRTVYSSRTYDEEAIMLTGDMNIADVEWIVQYRISDPYKYLFKVRQPQSTLEDINEAVMREVVGDRSVDEVLTSGKSEIASEVVAKVQEVCDLYDLGIKIQQVILQDVNPPREVKPSFNEVNEAEQEKNQMINEALSEYNKVIPKARGEAQRMVEESRGYAAERVNYAKGDAARFKDYYREYSKAPIVTRQRMYLETMNKILTKVGKKLITDRDLGGIIPLFQMDGKVKSTGVQNEQN